MYNRYARRKYTANAAQLNSRQQIGDAHLTQKTTVRVDNYNYDGYVVNKTITEDRVYVYDTIMRRDKHIGQMMNKGYRVLSSNGLTVTFRRIMY